MPSNQRLLESIAAVTGGDAVLTGEAAASSFTDWRGRYANEGLAVVFPSDTQQVSEVVKLCAANKISIVPQGGNTSLCGGSVPLAGKIPQIVINLSRMNRVRALDATNYTMTVEAGCKLESLYAAPEAADRLFPLGLTAIAPHCEIGGNLSTNAGGINVLRYGTARNLVLGLEVVLPDGRIWDGLRSLRKDNTGYDLKQLFIGAEGTLGIITEIGGDRLHRDPRSGGCRGTAGPSARHLRRHDQRLRVDLAFQSGTRDQEYRRHA
jgi:FAD/FMN-containing dehydrogenase